MIRGAEQAFKFTTSFDFKDICNIVAVFSQPYNEGTESAPMPIEKYYNRQVEKIDKWDASSADTEKTYYVDTTYYRYDSTNNEFKDSYTKPTASDISGGTITIWPLGDDCETCKVYKCDESYYQYNPSTDKWDITVDAPNTALQALTKAGVDNIPNTADKKRACVYNQTYYRYNGKEWKTSTAEILPIVEISYWEPSKESDYDRDKTYCALETYYKYVGNSWQTYGRPEEVAVLNDKCDTSKIYMMKEFYYQYNVATDQFEKTGVREVYYQYNATDMKWEECECPCMDAEEIDLWIEADADTSKIYVCKNVYYRYNAGLSIPAWEASNNMLVPVIEIEQWTESDYHDTSKIYMCPARYYQYNIEKSGWVEVVEVNQPEIIKLAYWSGSTDLDKGQIYLCGTTYYQYDSASTTWVSSAASSVRLTQINYPEEATDQSKIYECSPIYYAYKGGTWERYKNVADAVRNDGFYPVSGDPKSFIVILYAEETMRFNEKYKGRVQAIVYCDTTNFTEKSKVEYFPVYPTLTTEIFSVIPPNPTEAIRVLDAGEII